MVDRIVVKSKQRSRVNDSVEQALALGMGTITVQVVEEKTSKKSRTKNTDLRFSQLNACEKCGRSFDELTPHHFTFNARMGWCPSCEGLGVQKGASPAAIVRHPNRSILDGALTGWDHTRENPSQTAAMHAIARHIGFDADTPWCELSESHQLTILQGCGEEWIEPDMSDVTDHNHWKGLRFRWNGFFPAIDRATRSSWHYRKLLEELVTDIPCDACAGSRLRKESRHVTLCTKPIEVVCQLPLIDALSFFKKLKLDTRQRRIAGELLNEITSRLKFLVDVGLHYITLHRSAPTLSGGESQRIRLASQIGSGLTGVLYILDEPTIGLHPRDTHRLLNAINRLRDLGNTLIVVEHDRELIDGADNVFDFGPGSGIEGGEITAVATPKTLRTKRASLTGRYLSGREAIPVPTNRREVSSDTTDWPSEKSLIIKGARHHNLREIDVAFPLSRFIAVTGVSGSGKSSLITDTLYASLAASLHRARTIAGGHERIIGGENIDKVINVDQSPIGNSPSSNPATYTGLFDLVRELYAKLPDAKVRGYTINRFSFNRPGGRCEACSGMGQQCIEMHFLPDVWIQCESCGGTRYIADTLDVKFKGQSIADVLRSRVSDARRHFEPIPKIHRMLEMLEDVGLGYVQLGQSAPTLSGGEAQRVKLAGELGRPQTGKTLYILDEPTTGLHFDDLRKLLNVLHRLVDLGNTVICIEHNLDVIKTADWVIDMGPEAGADGGLVLATGTPETVASCKPSHTGAALKPILAEGPHADRETFDPQRQKTIEKEIAKPIRLDDAGVSTKMPWDLDGRKWHTEGRVDRKGQKIAWDSGVLEWLVDTIEDLGDFAATDWNDRARVEIRAPKTLSPMWFAHFRTGGSDLLDISLRTPARHFDNKTVVKALKVKTLDKREDLKIYGSQPRVKLRAAGREYDDIRILLRDFEDVNKKDFRDFLHKAADAYLHMVKGHQSDPVKGQPWKADGRKWHLSQKSINANHIIEWKPQLLLEFIGRLSRLAPDITFDWTGKVGVGLKRGSPKIGIGKIVTNMGYGLRIEIAVLKNHFTPLQVNRLGDDVRIRSLVTKDYVDFRLKSLTQNDTEQLAAILTATADKTSDDEASEHDREEVA